MKSEGMEALQAQVLYRVTEPLTETGAVSGFREPIFFVISILSLSLSMSLSISVSVSVCLCLLSLSFSFIGQIQLELWK